MFFHLSMDNPSGDHPRWLESSPSSPSSPDQCRAVDKPRVFRVEKKHGMAPMASGMVAVPDSFCGLKREEIPSGFGT